MLESMTRVFVELTGAEAEALLILARRERRTMAAQTAMVVRERLEREGLIESTSKASPKPADGAEYSSDLVSEYKEGLSGLGLSSRAWNVIMMAAMGNKYHSSLLMTGEKWLHFNQWAAHVLDGSINLMAHRRIGDRTSKEIIEALERRRATTQLASAHIDAGAIRV